MKRSRVQPFLAARSFCVFIDLQIYQISSARTFTLIVQRVLEKQQLQFSKCCNFYNAVASSKQKKNQILLRYFLRVNQICRETKLFLKRKILLNTLFKKKNRGKNTNAAVKIREKLEEQIKGPKPVQFAKQL